MLELRAEISSDKVELASQNEANLSISQEFDLAAQIVQQSIEREGERNVICAILAGSLSNKFPRLNSEDFSILDSDADIFFLVDKDIDEKLSPAGEVIPSENHVFRSYGPGYYDKGPFSPHIPNADVFIFPVDNAILALKKLKEQCDMSKNGQLIVRPGHGEMIRIVLMQAILTGAKFSGELPSSLVDAAKLAATALHGKKIVKA